MKADFLAAAQAELVEAVQYYNSKRDGLGDEFAEEVYRSLGRILAHPRAWPKLSARTRRCRTKRFP